MKHKEKETSKKHPKQPNSARLGVGIYHAFVPREMAVKTTPYTVILSASFIGEADMITHIRLRGDECEIWVGRMYST